MAKERAGRNRSESAGDLHDLRLKTLLDDLVGDNAATRPTARLDVGQRTLAASQESERLIRRMRAALDDTKGKLTRRAMLHRLWRALNLGMCRSGGKGRGIAAQLIFVNYMRKILNNFPRGARRGYATGLEYEKIKWFSGFSSVSRLRNLGASPPSPGTT